MAGVAGRSGTNKGKDKPFRDALRKRIAEAGDDPKRLDRIALALLNKAETGDVAAIKELADRLDGKVTQPIAGDDEAAPVRITRIERVIMPLVDRSGDPQRAPAADETTH